MHYFAAKMFIFVKLLCLVIVLDSNRVSAASNTNNNNNKESVSGLKSEFHTIAAESTAKIRGENENFIGEEKVSEQQWSTSTDEERHQGSVNQSLSLVFAGKIEPKNVYWLDIYSFADPMKKSLLAVKENEMVK